MTDDWIREQLDNFTDEDGNLAWNDQIRAVRAILQYAACDTVPDTDRERDIEHEAYVRGVDAGKAMMQAATRDRKTAQQRYEEFGAEADAESPLERLRFFCSLAMEGQDWIDVEPYFDAIEQAATRDAPSADALTYEEAQKSNAVLDEALADFCKEVDALGPSADAVDLSAENWAGVFHTAFRHAGDSRFASDAHNAIECMKPKEWLSIVDYMLIGIRKKIAASAPKGDGND